MRIFQCVKYVTLDISFHRKELSPTRRKWKKLETCQHLPTPIYFFFICKFRELKIFILIRFVGPRGVESPGRHFWMSDETSFFLLWNEQNTKIHEVFFFGAPTRDEHTNGIHRLRRIGERREYEHVPLVMVTAYSKICHTWEKKSEQRAEIIFSLLSEWI